MKKFISAVALASLMAPAANATTARLLAFGMNETDNEGMYFIEDDRNIFLNAATVADLGNKVILELGDKGTSAANAGFTKFSTAKTDQDFAPKAKGGLFRQFGNMTAGIYFGNESNTSALLRIVGSGLKSQSNDEATLAHSTNQFDLFLAGGDSLKWGVNFLYASNEDETTKKEDSSMATRLGVKADSWDAFVNLSLNSESEDKTVDAKFDGKFGIHFGGGYEVMEGLKAYGFMKTFSWDQIYTGTTTEGGFSSWSVGLAKTWQMEQGFLFVNANYKVKEIEVKATTNAAEAENVTLPITVGFEKTATNWLTLRGSVSQNLMGTKNNKNYSTLNDIALKAAESQFGEDTSGKDATLTDSTEVRSGATLHFGKLHIDGLIGGTVGTGTINETGSLRLDELMYRVAMTYDF